MRTRGMTLLPLLLAALFPAPALAAGIDTVMTTAPAEGSVHRPGSILLFVLEPACETEGCVLPSDAGVDVRVDDGTGAGFGAWQAATTYYVSGVAKLRHFVYAETIGTWTVEARASSASAGTTDDTPSRRAFHVGTLVSASATLDRLNGVVSVAFAGPPGTAAVNVTTAAMNLTVDALFAPASLTAMTGSSAGVGASARWTDASALAVSLPPATRSSGACASWRAAREEATSAGAVIPSGLTLRLRDDATLFDAAAGYHYDGTVALEMGATSGNPTLALTAPADVGGCQDMRVRATTTALSWDEVVSWDAPTFSTAEGVEGVVVGDHADLVAFASNASNHALRELRLPTSLTRPDVRYAFGASAMNCHGGVASATAGVNRWTGMVPGVRTSSGSHAYATTAAAATTIDVDASLPAVVDPAPGSECDQDPTGLTYRWQNLTSRADCLYAPGVNQYGWPNLHARASSRSLALPAFCLAASATPHRLRLRAFFGENPGTRSAGTLDVKVTVSPTPLRAIILGGGGGVRVLPRDHVFELDARPSFDPDAAAPNAAADNSTYAWSCVLLTRVSSSEVREDPCGSAFDAKMASTEPYLADIGPLLATNLGGRFRFTVTYGNRGKTANATSDVSMVTDPVPTVTLATPNPATVPSTTPLRLVGNVTGHVDFVGTAEEGDIAYRWISEPPIDFADARNFLTPTNGPSLVIAGGVLQPETSYAFTLLAKQRGVNLEGQATTGAIVVVGPPSGGRLVASPASGAALTTTFTVSTAAWVSPNPGALRYTIGYVARGFGRSTTDIVLSTGAATTVATTLPANATRDGVASDARVFVVADDRGATTRLEATVRVSAVSGQAASAAAATALTAALALGDVVMRATAAVTAAASLNSAGVAAASDAAELSRRRSIRAGAMGAVADAADVAVAAISETIEPEVLASYVTSIAAVSAVAGEMDKATARRGVNATRALVSAPASGPADLATLDAATSTCGAALEVVSIEIARNASNVTSSISNASSVGMAEARRRKLLEDPMSCSPRRRKLLESASGASAAAAAAADDDVDDDDAPVYDPVVALALSTAVAITRAAVRGQAANETASEMSQAFIGVRAERIFPKGLRPGLRAFSAPGRNAAEYFIPARLASFVYRDAHVDVFTYRISGSTLPSATRMMSDGSALELLNDDGVYPALPPGYDEVMTVHVPMSGIPMKPLERVLYEYRCARHEAGKWVVDDPQRRWWTESVEEERPGQGHVVCKGKGGVFLGYVVGLVIAPIDFTVDESLRESATTINIYWYVIGGVAAFAMMYAMIGLCCGMRRSHVKVTGDDYLDKS